MMWHASEQNASATDSPISYGVVGKCFGLQGGSFHTRNCRRIYVNLPTT
jgi:hypothetical protein